MAGGAPPVRQDAQLRRLDPAASDGMRTARMESAARRPIDRIGRKTAARPAIWAKTSGFLGPSRACSIDFGQIAPMFRLDAARYRNAIS